MTDAGRHLAALPDYHLVDYVESLAAAMLRRDAGTIDHLLRAPSAHALPRAVREEILAIRRTLRHTMRAPLETLRYGYRLQQLLAGDALPPGTDARQLELFPRSDEPA